MRKRAIRWCGAHKNTPPAPEVLAPEVLAAKTPRPVYFFRSSVQVGLVPADVILRARTTGSRPRPLRGPVRSRARSQDPGTDRREHRLGHGRRLCRQRNHPVFERHRLGVYLQFFAVERWFDHEYFLLWNVELRFFVVTSLRAEL